MAAIADPHIAALAARTINKLVFRQLLSSHFTRLCFDLNAFVVSTPLIQELSEQPLKIGARHRPPFRRIGFGTVARRILDHREQAFHPGPQVRVTIQTL